MNFTRTTTVFLTFLSLLFASNLSAQSPFASFGYNGCNLEEEVANFYQQGVEFGNPSCECGVRGMAMSLDGLDDYAVLDTSLTEDLLKDFSMSFYLFVDDHTLDAPILSIKKDCVSRDSALLIKYLSNTNELEIEISENIGDVMGFRAELPNNFCWHHVVLTKSGTSYSFYLNGVFIESLDIGIEVNLGLDHPVYLGQSECVGLTSQNFHGKIDEFELYNFPLTADQIRNLNVRADQILSNDTTIFEGNSVIIGFDGSCGNVSWSPTTDLNNTGTDPIATPSESTTYALEINHGNGGCIARDTIQINVVSESDISCDKLLLPNVFTPNGDGLNDSYGISNLFIVDQLESFGIYDRWGGKLFESNTKGEEWDGSSQNGLINAGMYVYKIKYMCKSESYRKVGNFSLMR